MAAESLNLAGTCVATVALLSLESGQLGMWWVTWHGVAMNYVTICTRWSQPWIRLSIG